MVYGFEGMAEEIGKMAGVDNFVERFSSDLTEIVNHLNQVSRREATNAVYMLYRRHADAVRKVMLTQMRETFSIRS